MHTKGKWDATAAIDAYDRAERFIRTDKVGIFIECRFDEYVSIKQSEANARLIAAAPELLEALKVVRPIFIKGFNFSDKTKSMLKDIVYNAIAKAEGK